MSHDAFKDREKAHEEQYFAKQQADTLKKLQDHRVLKSPISGEAMETIEIEGVKVDRCKQSGGIWLDAGELEQLLHKGSNAAHHHPESLLTKVLTHLFKRAA